MHPATNRSRQRLPRLLALVGLSAMAGGCGNTLYAIRANAAASKLEEAREVRAEEFAAYEYYYAKEHFDKAREEAAEADYGDAIELAEIAEDYADKAIRLARDAYRGGGR